MVHTQLVDQVSPRAILVDDILDSGHTLVSACQALQARGVQAVAITVTHGLFTGKVWSQLFALGVQALFVTDSCPQAIRPPANANPTLCATTHQRYITKEGALL